MATTNEETKKTRAGAEPVNRGFGVGGRKTSTVQVRLSPGKGSIMVNGKPMESYFHGRDHLVRHVRYPLELSGNQEQFNVTANARGGGIASQAIALRMGIARALLEVNPDLRIALKKAGLLRRDPRMKERKKYGHKRARRSFQYSKR